MFDFLSLKKAVADLSGAVRSKTEELENLRRERDRIKSAPATKEAVIGLISEQISTRAALYAGRLQTSLQQMGYGTERLIDAGGAAHMVAVLTAREHTTQVPSVYDVEASLCYLLKDQLTAGVASAIKQMQWPDGAEPLEDRAARIVKLDKKITDAEGDLKALREQAAAAGILV